MSIQYKSWLPESTLLDGYLGKKLSECLTVWSERWFVEAPEFTFEFTIKSRPEITEGVQYYWKSIDENLIAILPSSGSTFLAEKILGVHVPDANHQKEDVRFLEAIVSSCFESLITGIAEKFQIGSECQKVKIKEIVLQKTVCVMDIINTQGDSIINVELKLEPLFKYRKRDLNNILPIFPENVWEQAIDLQEITVGARLGASQVQVGNLESLSRGDVVVLDRKVGEYLELVVDQNVMAQVSCEAIQDGEDTHLKLVKMECGDSNDGS